MKRTIGFIISIVIVLAIAGIVIFNIRHKGAQNTQQYGILKPQPGEPVNIPQPVAQSPAPDQGTTDKTTTLRSSGKVLGTTTENSGAKSSALPYTAPKTTTTNHTQTPAVSASNGTASYTISELSFSVTVPETVHPVSTTRVGNVIGFYDAANHEYGEIEVLPNAYETLSALTQALQADPNVSGIAQTQVEGQPALVFNDARFGRTIAFVYKNNVYYLRGAFSGSAVASFKLL